MCNTYTQVYTEWLRRTNAVNVISSHYLTCIVWKKLPFVFGQRIPLFSIHVQRFLFKDLKSSYKWCFFLTFIIYFHLFYTDLCIWTNISMGKKILKIAHIHVAKNITGGENIWIKENKKMCWECLKLLEEEVIA